MAENNKPMPGPVGRNRGRGPKPKIDHPGRLFARIIKEIMKNYAPHCVIVLICIFISVLASVQGTMFMKTLIDSYILPLLGQENPDFSGLAAAILRVGVFYLCGALAAYVYNRLLINVSQGTLRNFRNKMFAHMEKLPIKYFDTHSHGDIMSIYTNDIDTLRQMISQSIPQIINSAVTIVSVLVSMIILNIPLTVLTLFMVGVMMVVTTKIAGQSSKYFIAQQKDIGKVNGYIEEMMDGQRWLRYSVMRKNP